MDKEIIIAIQNHKLWVDSLGKKGEKVDFENTMIEKIENQNLNLSQGSFIECTFRKMAIDCWDFYATMLCSSIFNELLMTSCIFVNADLIYTQFYNTKIHMTNFSKADLSNSIFENVEVENCKFINSLLDNNIFKNVHFKNIDFTGALIENIFFDELSTLKNIKGLDEAHIKSINIGTLENPIYLENQEALQWIKNKVTIKISH